MASLLPTSNLKSCQRMEFATATDVDDDEVWTLMMSAMVVEVSASSGNIILAAN